MYEKNGEEHGLFLPVFPVRFCPLWSRPFKFIETQRISPSNFAEHFPAIYKIVLDTLEDNATQDDTSER